MTVPSIAFLGFFFPPFFPTMGENTGEGQREEGRLSFQPQASERFLSRAWGLKCPSRAPRAHLGLGGGGREDSSPSFSSCALAEPQDLTGFLSPASHACLMPSTPPLSRQRGGAPEEWPEEVKTWPPAPGRAGGAGQGRGAPLGFHPELNHHCSWRRLQYYRCL